MSPSNLKIVKSRRLRLSGIKCEEKETNMKFFRAGDHLGNFPCKRRRIFRKNNIKIGVKNIVILVVNGISSMSCSVAAL